MNNIENNIENKHLKKKKSDKKTFFSSRFYFLAEIKYALTDKPLDSQVYKIELEENCFFSNKNKNLLVFDDDINFIEEKNDTSKIKKCVQNLIKINKLLQKRNITMIVLICPDKYDLYYPYIKNKKYPKSNFFSIYDDLHKDYINVDAYRILSAKLKKREKDIYYFGDTHWSPYSAKYIADELKQIIQEHDTISK